MDVSVRALKDGLSEHLARVRRGERLTVTLRGRPIAEIAPPSASASLSVDECLRRMAEAGDVILPSRPAGTLDDFEPLPLRPKGGRGKPRATASAIIVADRE